jgi:glucose 1-dehydrogenase
MTGHTALVTGANHGIGAATCLALAGQGCAVLVSYLRVQDPTELGLQQEYRDRRGQDATAVVDQILAAGGRAVAVEADLADPAAAGRLFDAAEEQLGPVDILVNNAGVERPADFLDIPEDSWDWMLDVDLKGAFLCAQACGRSMKSRGGAIVNISSIHEDATFPGFTPYCAAKGGMRMMMRNAALELAQYKIRVNNIAPGAIETPINESTLHDPDKMSELRRIIPLGRMGKPDDVTEVALFLASDRSRYVTGSTYYVDGGMVRFAEAL